MQIADTSENRAYIRRMLETIVKDDLLGPAQGPEEEIVGMSVRDRYILGRLGPRKYDGNGFDVGGATVASTPEEQAENEVAQTENKDGNADHIDHNEEKVAATDIAEEEPEEDVAENNVDITHSSSLVPSSLGLTFCIDESLPDIEVEVFWGSYYRTKSANPDMTDPKTGNPLNCWKRVQFHGRKVVKLTEWAIPEFEPDDRVGLVTVMGSVSKPIEHTRLVTLFLVNKQVEPKTNRDAAWIFQPEIIVRAANGGAIFRKRPLQDLSKDDEELKALDMIYRKKVEFAVGHNISIHAIPAKEDYERAVEIRTTAIPHYEVPATEVRGTARTTVRR